MYEDFGHHLPIGRDKSIELFMDMGFRVRYPKRYGRATQSGTREFPNLLVEKNVNGLNQVWEADMAHYLYGNTKLYTIYITDVYSQEIVGYGAYSTNLAINYVEVMDQAIRRNKSKGLNLKGLIHHSDGGKQYESLLYKELCNSYGIKQSMCMYSYENPYAEKTNDLINNGYLNIWRPKSLQDLRACQLKAVKDHNGRRRKRALQKLSPMQFRNQILNDQWNTPTYTLELKPRTPEQPRKRTKSNN
jgi:transposase InsO family protein